MSYFSIMIIGDNPEKQLAPFKKKPNAKWDDYDPGDRYANFFKIKKEAKAMVGQPELMISPAQPKYGYGYQLLKKHIDVAGMMDEKGEAAASRYDFAMKIFGDLPVQKSFETIYSEISAVENISDKIRDIYWAQPRCKAWQNAENKARENNEKWPFGIFCDPDDFIGTREKYIQAARDAALSPHAVIKDGKWYEIGRMGSWGIIIDKMEDSEWNKQVVKLIEETPDYELISIYQCHI